MARRQRRITYATFAANVSDAVVMIAHGDETFYLSEPIDLNLRPNRGFWRCDYEPFGIRQYGKARDEALRNFARHFAGVWHGIAEVADSELGPEAIDVKRRMRRAVNPVQEAA